MPDLDINVCVDGHIQTITIPEVLVDKLSALRAQYPEANLQFEPPHEISEHASRYVFLWCRAVVDGESYFQCIYGYVEWDDPTAINVLDEAMHVLSDWVKAKQSFDPSAWDEEDLIRLGKKTKGPESE